MPTEEQKIPKIIPTDQNEIGSPLNTGSKSGMRHQIQEDKHRGNDQNGDVTAGRDPSSQAKLKEEDIPQNRQKETELFNGNNDPDANKTQQP